MNTFDIVKIVIISSTTITVLVTLFSLIAKTLIVEGIKNAFQKENTQFNTDLQWDVKVRERAERVAEYVSLARSLRTNSSEEEYRNANRLSWELAMWLPEDIYIQVAQSIANPSPILNELTVVIAVRKLLLKENAGNLTENQVAHHAPRISENNVPNT